MKKIEVIMKPQSKYQEIIELASNIYKVAVKASPHEGKANQELVTVLATFFQVHRNQIQIIRGWKSKRKVIAIKAS